MEAGLEASVGSYGLDIQDGFLTISLEPQLGWLKQLGEDGGVAQVVLRLPSKHIALNSTPSTTKIIIIIIVITTGRCCS
jgi:hypothetical protein